MPFGPNFDTGNPKDTAFIDFLETLNTTLISAGVVKPTRDVRDNAGKRAIRTTFDRGWSPAFCIRRPDVQDDLPIEKC